MFYLYQPLAEGANPTTQQMILLAAVVLASFFLMRMLRRTRPQDGSPQQYRREVDSATEQNQSIRRDMEQVLIELDRLSRDVNAQLDTRFVKLEHAIRDADKRISALRILLDAAKSATASAGDVEARGTVPGLPPSDASESAHGASIRTNEAADHRARISPAERSTQIYDLADQGLSPLQIAQRLDQRVGEVELILNLRGAAGGRH